MMLANHNGNCKFTAGFLFPKQRGNFSSSLRGTTLETVCIEWGCGDQTTRRSLQKGNWGVLPW